MKSTELPKRFQSLLHNIKDALQYTGFNPAEVKIENCDATYFISHEAAELTLTLDEREPFNSMFITRADDEYQVSMYELQQQLKATKVAQHLQFQPSFLSSKVNVSEFVETLLSYDLNDWIIRLDIGIKGANATFIQAATGRQESMLANREGKIYYTSWLKGGDSDVQVETLEEGIEALIGKPEKKEHKKSVEFVLKAIEVANMNFAGKASGLSFYLYANADVVDMGMAFMSELFPPLTVIEPSVTVHLDELTLQPSEIDIERQYELLLSEGRQVILDVLLAEEAKARASEEAQKEEPKSIIIH